MSNQSSNSNNSKFGLYDIVVIGLMAAVCFVTTYFLRIEIPTPAGPTNIKIGNVFCLLAGLLFGGWRGGLAAGIGSMFFDIVNPAYITSAPFTLVFFFMMGFVAGLVSHMGGRNGKSLTFNIIGALGGALSYFVLHISKSVIELLIAGSDFTAALVACSTKMITSGINVVTATVLSVIIVIPLRLALEKAGVYKKLHI
ncbi:MAG: ECF transporter S component [Oscillospiraceae bacterium]|nr:ECF transporter S component [Oscillospiraceae bacterium]